MKKGKFLLSSLVAVLALTGCGGKKLTCTMSEESAGMEMEAKVEVSFNGDKMDTMKLTMDIAVPEEYADQKDELIELFADNEEGVTAVETSKGIRITADSDSEFFEELDIDSNTVTYDDLKKALEDEGYSCK